MHAQRCKLVMVFRLSGFGPITMGVYNCRNNDIYLTRTRPWQAKYLLNSGISMVTGPNFRSQLQFELQSKLDVSMDQSWRPQELMCLCQKRLNQTIYGPLAEI